MELGNMIFGHSHGELPLDDRYGFSAVFEMLTEALDDEIGYGKHYENAVFYMHPYCWCGGDACPQCGTGEQFNFFHKPSGLGIRWYKYPFRDSYMTHDTTKHEFASIVLECVLSIKQAAIEANDKTIEK